MHCKKPAERWREGPVIVSQERSPQRLPIRTKILFGCGQGVETAATFVANTFLLFYLTSVVGISPATAGTIIFLSLVIDAIADPLIGSWSDRSHSRWGKRLPFMVVGLPIICVASIALFATPLTGNTLPAISVALMLNVLLRVGTSLFALPYSALTAELTSDYDERSSVTVYRMIFGFVATVLTIVPAFGIIFVTKDAYASREAYMSLGALLCAAVLLLGLVCILGVRQTVLISPTEHLPPSSNSRSLFADVKDLCRNRSFLILFGSALYLLVIAGSMNALNLYAYNYFWKLPASLNQLPIFSAQAGLLAGIPLTVLLLKRLEKRDVVLLGVGLIAVSQTLSVLIAYGLLGPMPNAKATSVLTAASAIFGACNSFFFIGFQSMVADAVDEHELKFGQRCDGLYYSALVFSSKSAVGLGSLIAGIVLAVVGLDGKAVNKAAAISDTAESFLGLLWGAGHGLAFLLSVPLILAYRLNRSQHTDVLKELDEQRLKFSAGQYH